MSGSSANRSKTRRNILGGAVGCLVAAPVLAGCSSGALSSMVGAALDSGLVKAPTFAVQSFGVQSLSMDAQVLQINTIVTNPNQIQLTINAVDLAVMLAGIDLGKATAQQSFVVPANGSVTVPLTLNVNLIQVFSQSVGLLNIRLDTPLPYALQGSVNVSQLGIPVPVNIQGTVTPNDMIGLAQLLAQATGGVAGGGNSGSAGLLGGIIGGALGAL